MDISISRILLTVACDVWIVSIRHAGGDLRDWKVLVSVLIKVIGRSDDTR